MHATKITSKGQITLPKKVREHLKVDAGDLVNIHIKADGTVVIAPKIDFRKLRGIVDAHGIHLTIEEINEVISQMGDVK